MILWPSPLGCHVLGRLKFPNTQTHGTPTAAAKCIGPLSCPTKHTEFRIAAALSRGDNRPHRFTLGPTQFAVSFSERSNSSLEPINTAPNWLYFFDNNLSRWIQLLSPQSLLLTFPPKLMPK